MNTPIMPLEETINRLRNGPIDTAVERSALHHLEAGKRAECVCDDFRTAQQSGTDNEMYGALIWRRANGSWTTGCMPSDIHFCPWCGGTLPTHEQKGQG